MGFGGFKMLKQHKLFKVGNFIFKDDAFAPECQCGKEVYYLNIGRNHFWVCDNCKKYTHFGSNLLSSWRNEDKKIWEKNKKKLNTYEMVG